MLANSTSGLLDSAHHRALLRQQVASTLHKTLQLEYTLTSKELESYEKHSATADLECHRALAALHAAQVVMRERRRDLDVAIMERGAVTAIVKHLKLRLESLRKRMWDGEDAKRRGSVQGVLLGNNTGDAFDGDDALLDLMNGSTGVGAVSNGQVTTGNSPLHRDHMSSQPSGSSNAAAILAARRHSSPGFVSFNNVTSANTSLDEAELLSGVDSAVVDQEELKNFADTIAAAESASSLQVEDAAYISMVEKAPPLTISIPLNDEDFVTDSRELEQSAGHSFKALDDSPAMRAPATTASSSFTFPTVTMTRLHSSGSLATSSKTPADLAALRRASLQSVALSLSPQNSEMALSGSIPSSLSGTSVACISYQRGQCIGTGSEGCKAQHACVRCGGGHPVILCKKDRNVCVKWNMEECSAGCYREHRCLRCASRNHTLRVCPIRPLGGSEFCFAWNSAGTCRIMDCRRLHECIRCGASHPSIICPENLDNYLTEYISRRRSEGLVDDDLLRLELQLTHSLPVSSTSGASPSSAILPLSSLSATSTSTTPNPGNGLLLLPPLPPSSSQPSSGPTSATGSGMGPPMSPHTSLLFANHGGYAHREQALPQSSGLGMSGSHHPMHLAAAMAAARVVSGGGPLSAGSAPREPSTNSSISSTRDNNVFFGAGSGFASVYGSSYDDKRKKSIGGGYDGNVNSLLTESERMVVCRDYNNMKCDADESRCRFRHVCLRCGGGHRERQCLAWGEF
ncbi:hypothetical protein BC830DRAFT_587446 [Chytriomyces sp. MP71]|nr:hypothetical protein BC830DRAFT_587446 [Chytriomyces sp. MP71]